MLDRRRRARLSHRGRPARLLHLPEQPVDQHGPCAVRRFGSNTLSWLAYRPMSLARAGCWASRRGSARFWRRRAFALSPSSRCACIWSWVVLQAVLASRLSGIGSTKLGVPQSLAPRSGFAFGVSVCERTATPSALATLTATSLRL